ncbi:hypothetical protein ARMSODRAFT_597854 [Armillaria solidipes]|uniref:SMODS and SLOG-associating 2TM effector domain-containing protein n=1 Tax=Armillaria solidipes TaxID=1076256 RepID=A0A2H3BDE4_9AGAR|nr:hypothetical protein ARMSODRAFT_597854 [Armillaria solidipes]
MDAPDRVGNSHSQTLGSSSLAGLGPTIAAPVPIIGPQGNSTHTSIRHSSPLSDQGDAPRSDTSYAPLHSASLSNNPLPPLPGHDPFSHGRNPSRRSDIDLVRPVIDWVVPVSEKAPRLKTVGERLEPTLTTAETTKDKYKLKARMTGYALNIAIGLQVLLGALTTALSAATSGKQTSIVISILGGVSTMVASYLARARGSNEPQRSLTRVKDLEQFIRECRAFDMDHGHETGHEFDLRLENFRRRYEELLGNTNREQKHSTPENTGQNPKVSVMPGIV